jgi:hypothetical protein
MSLSKHSIWIVVRKYFLSEQSYSEHPFWLKFLSYVCLCVDNISLQSLSCGKNDNMSLLLHFVKNSTNILHLIWAPLKHTDDTFCFLLNSLRIITQLFWSTLKIISCYISVRRMLEQVSHCVRLNSIQCWDQARCVFVNLSETNSESSMTGGFNRFWRLRDLLDVLE